MPGFFTGEPTKDELQEQIAQLTATNENLTGINRDLNIRIGELEQRERTVGGIATQAEAALEAAEKSGDIMISAEQEALAALKKQLIDQKREPLRESILAEKGEELTTLYGPEWTTELRGQLGKQFAQDGTYRDLERSIKAAAIKAVTDELLADKKAAIEEDLASPEGKTAIEASAREKAANSETIAEYEKTRRAELEAACKEAALTEAKQGIDAEIEAGAPALTQKFREDWLNSPVGHNYRKTKRKDAEAQLKNLTLEELARQVGDEELLAVATELAAAKKEEAVESLRSKEFIEAFMNGGIDTTTIPAETLVTLQLGVIGRANNPKYDQWQVERGYSNEPKTVKALKIARELFLLSRGDGTFLVQKDSLMDSTDEYVRDSAIANTVIIIGRQVKDNTAKAVKIEQRLSQGSVLFFDDDTSTPNIQSARYPVVNIKIGDQEALADINIREFVAR